MFIRCRLCDTLKSFEPIAPKTIEKRTTQLLKEHNERIMNIEFLGRGEASAVFKIVTEKTIYALKTALYPERTQKILNEAKIRTKFIDKGVECVPAANFTDQEYFKNGAVIFDYAEGEHSDYHDEATIKKIARNLASIHSVEYDVIQDGFKQMKKNHQFLRKTMNHIETDYPNLLNDKISKAFSFALDEYETIINENKDLFPFGLSGIMHGDLGGHFITDTNGKVWLVDWENSEYGDLIEEVCTFIFESDINTDMRDVFFKEYKAHFTPASGLNFEEIGYFYIFPIPAYNVCWGIDQLNTNLFYKLEPERKLFDIRKSAENWKRFFTESTSLLILEGVLELTDKLKEKHNLSL